MTTQSTHSNYEFKGLLEPYDRFDDILRYFKRERLKLYDRLKDIPEYKVDDIITNADLSDPDLGDYYRELTSVEIISIRGIRSIEKFLDFFSNEYTPLAMEDFVEICFLVSEITTYIDRIDLSIMIDMEKNTKRERDRIGNIFTLFVEELEPKIRPCINLKNSLDYGRKNKKVNLLTTVLTEIVVYYYSDHKKRPPLDHVLNEISMNYCGKSGLIRFDEDIDREDKTVHYYSSPNSNSGKTIAFKTINNKISEIFKKTKESYPDSE